MVGVGEAHPAEPVVAGGQRVEPGDRAVGHPFGVVPLAGDRVVVHLWCSGVAAAERVDLEVGIEHRVEHPDCLGMGVGQPPRVVQRPGAGVRRRLEMLESTVRTGHAVERRLRGREHSRPGEPVLGEPRERVEKWLEVRLADDRRAVAGTVEHGGDRRRVDRKGNTVHPHAVGARVLAGDDGGPRRHAHDRLRVGALVPVAAGGERVGDRCTGNRATVAPERVEALLIGRDEQDLATHQVSPSA